MVGSHNAVLTRLGVLTVSVRMFVRTRIFRWECTMHCMFVVMHGLNITLIIVVMVKFPMCWVIC